MENGQVAVYDLFFFFIVSINVFKGHFYWEKICSY